MSKKELVLTKCLSELIYFVPSVMLTLTAVIRYDLGLNPIGVVIVFIQISLYITLVLFVFVFVPFVPAFVVMAMSFYI